MNYATNQLAHSKLLSPSLSAEILAGSAPPVLELANHLLTTCMDAHFVTNTDPQATWIDKRLSHQSLVVAFMLALMVDHSFGPVQKGVEAASTQEMAV